MTLSNFLTEAAVNYKIGSGNPEKMLYDFYVLSFISTINLSPEKAKTGTFGDIGFQGGFLGKSDRVKEDIEYAQDVLLPVLKEKLIKGLFVSICAEIRHIKDRPQNYANTPLATSKVFRDYYRNYSLMDKGMPKEFELKRLREPKSAIPKSEGYKRSYQAATKAIKDAGSTPYEFVQMCEYAFKNMSWAASYGGKNWAAICAGYRLLVDSKSKDQVSVAIDHAYDLEHNTGAALNKVKDFYIKDEKGTEDFDWMGKALDLKRDAKSMNKLIEKCSGDMKRLALQAMALSPINYMKKTPAPEAVMQQTAKSVGGEYLNAFNQGAPVEYRVKTETKEKKPASGTLYGFPIAPVPFQGFNLSIFPTFKEGNIYYDAETKCYIKYVGPTNNNIPIVSVYAVTHQTNIGRLNGLIDDYQPGFNSYVVKNVGNIKVLHKLDIDNAEAAVNVSKKQELDKKKTPPQGYKTAPSPKENSTIPYTFHKNKIYFDDFLKVYVRFVKPDPNSNIGVIVSLLAITPETTPYLVDLVKSKINMLINILNKEPENPNSYVAMEKDLMNVSQKDIDSLNAVIYNKAPIKSPEEQFEREEKQSKEYISKLVPNAPMPISGSKVNKFSDDKIYYDSKTKAYVKYKHKSGWTDPKIMELYATTYFSDASLLKDKIEILKKEFGQNKQYVAAVKDIIEIDESDTNKVKQVVEGEKSEVKKPNLDVYFPLYKLGDKVYLDVKKSVSGQVIDTFFDEESEEFYKIKVIDNSSYTGASSPYGIGKTFTKTAKYIDDLNPKYKVTDRVIFIQSGAEGIIVQTPFKQDATSNYLIKITKAGESNAFKKGEEIVVNTSRIAPLKRENASARTNAIKKQSAPGNIPSEAWDKMSENVKNIFAPYKKDKNTSYVYYTEKGGRQLGLYGVIEKFYYSQVGDTELLTVEFRYYVSKSSQASFATISENNFIKLQDYKSALEGVNDSPLYNAPFQNFDSASMLKDYQTNIVGMVFYHIPAQQYVKVKTKGAGVHTGIYFSVVPVAKTKFTPAYYTFNWAEMTTTTNDLQQLSEKAQDYLTKNAGDIVKELMPKEKPERVKTPEKVKPVEMNAYEKEIPVHYIKNEDFLDLIDSEALSSQSEIRRDQFYYDITTKLVVSPITSKKQFGDSSKTLDVVPYEKILINYTGDKVLRGEKVIVPKTMSVYVTDLHKILDY